MEKFLSFSLVGLIVLAITTTSLANARNYTSKKCPVVGNTNSSIYHVPGGEYYVRMLV